MRMGTLLEQVRKNEEGFASDAQRRAAFAQGYKAKGKKKKEELDIQEDGHTDVASAIRQCKTILEDSMQVLQKLKGMNPEESLPSWWTNKLAVSSNSMNKLRDYFLVPTTEEVELDEALKPKDKKVVDAFYDGKSMEGDTLSTDGKKLTKSGLGAQTIATKDGSKFKIVAEMDSQHTQSVVKYIKKTFPKNVVSEEVELDEAFKPDQVKAAVAIARDSRFSMKQMVDKKTAIEKIAKGLSKDPAVKKVLDKVYEEFDLNEKAGDIPDLKNLVGELVKASGMHLAQSKRVQAHVDMMTNANAKGPEGAGGLADLKKIVGELEKASEAHKRQSKSIDAHVKFMDKMESLDEMAYKPGSFKSTKPQEKGAKAFDNFITQAKRYDDLDLKDYQKARALYVQASDPASREKLKKFIFNLDTEPKELVMNLIGVNDPQTFLQMYPNAKKGQPLTTVSFAHRNMKSEETELEEMDMKFVLINMQNKIQGFTSNEKDAKEMARRTKSTIHPIKKKISDKTLDKMNALARSPKELRDLGIIEQLAEADIKVLVKDVKDKNFLKDLLNQAKKEKVMVGSPTPQEKQAGRYTFVGPKDKVNNVFNYAFDKSIKRGSYNPATMMTESKEMLDEISRANANKVNSELSKILGKIRFTHFYQMGPKAIFKLPKNVKHEVVVNRNDMKDAADLLMKDKGDVGFMFKQGQLRLAKAMDSNVVEENELINKAAGYISHMQMAERIDPADIDDTASEKDIENAAKNIIMQLRKSVSMRGNKDVEFADGKKKVDMKIAQKAIDMHMRMKPQDKLKFQNTIATSYKSLLNAIKGK